jgi:hypothetical protein
MHLPLPIIVILAALVLLVILLITGIRKKNKKLIGPVIILMIAIFTTGVWYGLKEYNRVNKDLSSVKADVKISAMALIAEYENNDSASNQKYLGQVVEVNGIVKDIEKDDSGYYTVILGDTSTLSAIRCAMDTTHQQDAALTSKGSSVLLRGNCTGFRKDEMGLGSDVILNRSVIIKDKK